MAKRGRKGKGKKRRYYGKKARKTGGRRPKKTPVLFSLGTAKTAWDVGTKTAVPGMLKTTVFHPTVANVKATGTALYNDGKYFSGPMVAGFVLSYGNHVPIVGKAYQKLVKRHLDAAARAILGKGFKA